MKRFFFVFTAMLFIISISYVSLAAPKLKASVDVEFLMDIFEVKPSEADYLSRFELGTEELSFILYLYSASGRPVSKEGIDFIVRSNQDWGQLSFYFGLPPILLEDDVLVFRRPWRPRLVPPAGQSEYKKEVKGDYEEKLEIKKNKYEYKYENKRLGITEKVEIKKNKYSYYYKDRTCQEKLEVKYPSNKYEYYYKDFRTGEEIKRKGKGRPVNPDIFYGQIKEKEKVEPGFHFTIEIEF